MNQDILYIKQLLHTKKIKLTTAMLNKYINLLMYPEYINQTKNIPADIQVIEKLSNTNKFGIRLVSLISNTCNIKIFQYNHTTTLSQRLPMIESFGFVMLTESPLHIILSSQNTLDIYDISLTVPDNTKLQYFAQYFIDELGQLIIHSLQNNIAPNNFNQLIMRCNLNLQETSLFQAMAAYLIQTNLHSITLTSIANTLKIHAPITTNIFLLFDARFNNTTHSNIRFNKIRRTLKKQVDQITQRIDELILQSFIDIIEAMVRTNYYQTSNFTLNNYISFKLESAKLDFLVLPKPLYEIFVFSHHFEGIHLRANRVSRGGLRWSDRVHDFRTEILDLVKTQIVKNSIIIPTGAKGGFICKKLPSILDKEQYLQTGIDCYKQFISGLLDITDNLVQGTIQSPPNTICYDIADPYLVVAADKGTATFSDYANAIAQQRNFWLGDGFASGGKTGYDHKKLQITSRGSWIAAQWHFRHLNINIQQQDFTVVGIGDMAGDVFGNGMLMSQHICLLAAFNHMHIFLDPSPNSKISYAERQRLAKLPQSTWMDYNIKLISRGGGIYSRYAKSITLSPEVQSWLGINQHEVAPHILIMAILKAQVTLIYNGGIGTYIKSVNESHEMVRDKVNDMVRINAHDIKARVIVEGGNLGVTQLGRIEFAKNGGLINTDAIDNSAAVDCSDHEVNLKILFSDIMQDTSMKISQRNQMLQTISPTVTNLVLYDNYLQNQILNYTRSRASALFGLTINYINKLIKNNLINPQIECLPDAQEILIRKRLNIGLTTPELSVLLAYTKILLKNNLLQLNIVTEPSFQELLLNYFPQELHQKYAKYIYKHYLYKEIIANQLANLIVNRTGLTFISRFEDEFSNDLPNIIKAFWITYKLFDANSLYKQIEALDNIIDIKVQIDLITRIKKILERASRLILNKMQFNLKIDMFIPKYNTIVLHLLKNIYRYITPADYPNIQSVEQSFIHNNVSIELAQICARSGAVPQLLEIAFIVVENKRSPDEIAMNYFYAGNTIYLDWLRQHIVLLSEDNKWQSLSRSALLSECYLIYYKLLTLALQTTKTTDRNFMRTWFKQNSTLTQQIINVIQDVQNLKTFDVAILSGCIKEIFKILSSK